VAAVSLPQLWTIDEAAAYLRRSPETVRLMLVRGEIPGVKLARRWFVNVDALEDQIEAAS
jgi:excisionase family DNA binding protein